MTSGAQTIIYPVTDLSAAKQLFSVLLGVEPHTDQAYYVGYAVAGQEIGLDPHGRDQGTAAPTAYWHVDDIDATLAALVGAGGTVRDDVREVGGGRRIATVTDADGNPIGLLQDG